MAIQVFEEVRFPPKISFGFQGGPQFRTAIASNPGGYEQRNIDWSLARARYSASMETKTQAELDEVKDFFYAMRGRGIGFRFLDWRDYCSDQAGIITALQSGASVVNSSTQVPSLPAAGVLTPQVITASATAADQTHQLIKTYTVGSLAGDDYVRTIAKPIASHVRAYVDGVEDGSATVDTATGIVTLNTVIAGGEEITADYLFDVPSRFDQDFMPDTLEHFDSGTIDQIEIVELRNFT